MQLEAQAIKSTNNRHNLIENAKLIAPILRAEASNAEKQRHLTDKTVETIKEAGLYRMLIPQSLGGIEADPLTVIQVIEEISYNHAAAGWCFLNSIAQTALAGAFLGDDAVAEIFGNTVDLVVAGSGACYRGQAVQEADKYLINGNYSYGSGITHANYVFCGVTVMDGDRPRQLPNGCPEQRLFYFPRNAITVGDNWHVLGLQGTGSFDFSVTNLYQSETFSFLINESQPKRGGGVYTLGMPALLSLAHTGFALGVGRRALDELAAIAVAKEESSKFITNSPSFQERFALTEAKMRSARSFSFEIWNDVFSTLERGSVASSQQIVLSQLNMRYVHEVALEVCTFAYRASDAVALRESALQKCYRDISAAVHHKYVFSDQILQNCGKNLLEFVVNPDITTYPDFSQH